MVQLRSMTRAARSAESENEIAQNQPDQEAATSSAATPPKRKALAEVNAPNNASTDTQTVAPNSRVSVKRHRLEREEICEEQHDQKEAGNKEPELEQQVLALLRQTWQDALKNPERVKSFLPTFKEEMTRLQDEISQRFDQETNQIEEYWQEQDRQRQEVIQKYDRKRERVQDKFELRLQERARNIPMRDSSEVEKARSELSEKLRQILREMMSKEFKQLDEIKAASQKRLDERKSLREARASYTKETETFLEKMARYAEVISQVSDNQPASLAAL